MDSIKKQGTDAMGKKLKSKCEKLNLKKLNELFDAVNTVFPINQGNLPVKPNHAITMCEKYGLTLNVYLNGKGFAQTSLDEDTFDWNNIELEMVNLHKMIRDSEQH